MTIAPPVTTSSTSPDTSQAQDFFRIEAVHRGLVDRAYNSRRIVVFDTRQKSSGLRWMSTKDVDQDGRLEIRIGDMDP